MNYRFSSKNEFLYDNMQKKSPQDLTFFQNEGVWLRSLFVGDLMK